MRFVPMALTGVCSKIKKVPTTKSRSGSLVVFGFVAMVNCSRVT